MAPVRTTGGVVAAAAAISIFSMAMLSHLLSPKKNILRLSKKKKKKARNGLVDAIGNTPLIRINSLSEATGCEVCDKAIDFSIFLCFYHLGFL
jgi:cysteine synthase A